MQLHEPMQVVRHQDKAERFAAAFCALVAQGSDHDAPEVKVREDLLPMLGCGRDVVDPAGFGESMPTEFPRAGGF